MKTVFLPIPNPLVKLSYSPAKDILLVEWPSFDRHLEAETASIPKTIVETLKTFQIRCLLLDLRKTGTDFPEPQLMRIMIRLAKSLKKTPVQRVARVATADSLLKPTIKEIVDESHLSIPVDDFHQVEDAVKWLASKKKLKLFG